MCEKLHVDWFDPLYKLSARVRPFIHCLAFGRHIVFVRFLFGFSCGALLRVFAVIKICLQNGDVRLIYRVASANSYI